VNRYLFMRIHGLIRSMEAPWFLSRCPAMPDKKKEGIYPGFRLAAHSDVDAAGNDKERADDSHETGVFACNMQHPAQALSPKP